MHPFRGNFCRVKSCLMQSWLRSFGAFPTEAAGKILALLRPEVKCFWLQESWEFA